jgi:hypothetical protein
MIKEMSCYIYTSDDWFGNFHLRDESELASLIFLPPDPIDKDDVEWLVSVGGNDDYSLHKHFDNEEGALVCFLKILQEDEITKKYLNDLGFYFGN